jgi:hypothetical protein
LDIAATLEWSPRDVEEAGPEFVDAIMWCLRGVSRSGESDAKLEKWREELFLKVVEPLKYYYDQFDAVGSQGHCNGSKDHKIIIVIVI